MELQTSNSTRERWWIKIMSNFKTLNKTTAKDPSIHFVKPLDAAVEQTTDSHAISRYATLGKTFHPLQYNQ
jgi:hypothetical protein